MYAKQELTDHLIAMGIRQTDTLLVHSSMKAIGEVEGRADGVLDVLMAWLRPGLLVLPTHTWSQIDDTHNVFDPKTEPACVGILPNLFMHRPGVVRSWHPTHSVAAFGADAAGYAAGEEQWETPCPRQGCWGKLIDRQAKILFLGCSLTSNTFLHGVEEWNEIPNRIAPFCQFLKIRLPDGTLMDRPMHRHHSPGLNVSEYYDKMEAPLLALGIAINGRFADASCVLCDAAGMDRLTSSCLKMNPDLFADGVPIPAEWYSQL